MIKVLIADDEPKIRRGINESIDWLFIGMEVCSFAANGAEAIKAVMEQEPDICLVDICMPKVSGLKLIERIHQINKDTICIVITGFDEFEYAQTAVKLGVFDYILKPVNEKTLVNTLMRARESIISRDALCQKIEKAEKMLKKNIPFLRERFIIDLIKGKVYEEDIKEHMQNYSIHLAELFFFLRLELKGEGDWKEKDLWNRQLLQFALNNIAVEVLQQYGETYAAIDHCERIFVLANTDSLDDLHQAESEISRVVQSCLKMEVTIKFKQLEELTKLCDVYEQWRQEDSLAISRTIIQAKEYIENNYWDSELSVQKMALKNNVNASYLSRTFKAEMSVNITDYIAKMRMQKALELLNNTDLKIYEIAAAVGYKSQHYFSFAFKHVLGISPIEYRKKNGGI
jgi:Response regulator containing CheY-like receiver domain and AraC-type DNA-binding domain